MDRTSAGTGVSTVSPPASPTGSLKEWVLVSLPDCLRVRSMGSRSQAAWDEYAVACGEFLRRAEALCAPLAGTGPDRVTVETSAEVWTAVRLDPELALVLRFSGQVPLGLIRAQSDQVAEQVRRSVQPSGRAEEVRRVVAEVGRRASEPRAVWAHLARSAQIPVDALQHPEQLTEHQLEAILSAVPRSF